jgi:peptide methionine sulfoxide reductase MsrA
MVLAIKPAYTTTTTTAFTSLRRQSGKKQKKMSVVVASASGENDDEEKISTSKSNSARRRKTTTRRESTTTSRRGSLVALTTAACGVFALQRGSLFTDGFQLSSSSSSSAAFAMASREEDLTYVYFGNGCFWGRQHEFVSLEKEILNRSNEEVRSLAGYAGGKRGAGGKNKDTVCYYYGGADTVYERLGHAEVVQIAYKDEDEFKKFCEVYFKNFNKTPFGMQRVDPQDSGPGYRNVVGIPGGIDNERLMKQMEAANVNGMKLVRGEGNDFDNRGKPTENDQINLVWIVDSDKLPFYPAEMYHQFHDGLGYKFPESYTVDLKRAAAKNGVIGKVAGCPEMRERAFADFESLEG